MLAPNEELTHRKRQQRTFRNRREGSAQTPAQAMQSVIDQSQGFVVLHSLRKAFFCMMLVITALVWLIPFDKVNM